MRVSIFGLGYVGAVSCACFARDGMEVIGVDVNPDKVALINAGRPPIIEEDIGEAIADSVAAGRLRATTSVDEAVAATDISLISVGTPSQTNGSLDLTAVRRVSEAIGSALARKKNEHLVVVRSTVLPGTVGSLVIPTLEAASGRTLGDSLGVCFNPEFLREGSSVRDHYDPPFTVIGHRDEQAAQRVARLYASVTGETIFTSIEAAEMVKYACNTFHALKITFGNEIGLIARALGVDSHVVMNLVCRDTKLNISAKYLTPGFAFGGSCLPKDLRALLYRARDCDVEVPMLRAVLDSNRMQVELAVERVVQLKRRKVSMLGLSFKAGTDDLRESPLVEMTERLIGKGFDVRVYDANVALARLTGANKAYIEREIPHISSLILGTLAEAVAFGEVLVVGNAAAEFQHLTDLCQPGQAVIDMVRLDALRERQDLLYEGIAW